MYELHTRRTRWAFLAAVGIGLATLTPARAADPSEAEAGPKLNQVARKAWDLAAEGKLDALWNRIRQLPAGGEQNPSLAALRKDIRTHEAHQKNRRRRIETAYAEKLDELKTQTDDDKVREALSTAVEAYDLSGQSSEFLQRDRVRTLIERAEKKARKHVRSNEWLKALDYYRGLDLLYENQDRYSDPLRTVSRHVAALRLYAPDRLYELYKQKAKEQGDEPPAPWVVEDDNWKTQLEKIEPVMLNEGMALAARKHVQETDFEKLLRGGIEALEVLFETKGLEQTFPALGEPKKVEPFVAYLDGVADRIENRNVDMGYGKASRIVQNLLERNEQTVDLPRRVIVHEMGEGATGTLDDFSSFIWPHQKSRFERTTSGKFTGVGIQISLVNDQLTVVTPLADTPAHRAGLRAGDKIVTIDGKSTMGIDLDQAVDKITGPEGTEVTLGIKRPGHDKAQEVTLTRSQIKIISVKGWDRRRGGGWDFYIDPALKIGYVRLTTFGPDTADELDAAIQQMNEAQGINGLILDLRFNPGGRLDAAVAIANRFLDSGTIVSTTQKTILGRTWKATADEQHTYDHFPVVAMINKGSASASEIVSGAIQDHNRGLVVGEQTFGKGSVQNLFHIGDKKAYLKLTTQYYKLPDGRIIHRRPGAEDWGVHPDVRVRMTDQQVAEAIRARTVLDVLRDPDEPEVDPSAILSTDENDDEQAKDGEKKDGQQKDGEDELPQIERPEQLLERGIDPQLETALLLLKTRLLGEPRG